MDHIGIYLPTLVIFTSFGLPRLCGAEGEFAVNIAYGKPATQSSTYIGRKEFGDTPGYPYEASLAVDGNKNTSFKDDGCSHTNFVNNSAWWEVDLLGLYKVSNITIYQRTDGNTNWLSGFVTRGKLSNNSFINIDNPKSSMNGTVTIPVHTSLKFNKIRIELNKTSAGICLCEVEVLTEINVAENKPATQSSDYVENAPFIASLAVDGNTNTKFNENSCSHTNSYQGSAWWKVDLQALYLIIGIRIYQRSDAKEDRLRGFTLFGLRANGLYESIQTPQPYHTGEIDIPISPPRMFREIMLQLNNSSEDVGPIITLCEVQAFAVVISSQVGTISLISSPVVSLATFNENVDGNDVIVRFTNYLTYEGWVQRQAIQVLISTETSEIMLYLAGEEFFVFCEILSQSNILHVTFKSNNGTMCSKPPHFPRRGLHKFIPGKEGNWSYNFVSLTINCIKGYIIEGSSSVMCVDIDRWNGSFGRCSEIHCTEQLVRPNHGMLQYELGVERRVAAYNSTVSITCDSGYSPMGNILLRCNESAQWDGPLGSCVVKRCNEPMQQVEHGFLTFNGGIEGNGTYNTTVSLNCLEGYKLNSVGQFRCADNEKWQGSLGFCLVKRCNEPMQQVEHGFLTFNGGIEGNGTYNTTVSLNCLEGYKLNSVGQFRCADNEKWQGSLGFCLVKRCNEPMQQVEHGFLTFNGGIEGNGTYNTTVSLNCLEGYKLNSVGQFRCADNEQWQGSLGFCLVKRCNEPMQQVEHGFLTFNGGIEGNGTYNTTVSLNCLEGYKLNSVGQFRCADNEQWQGSLGFCLVKRCNEPMQQVEHGFLTFNGGIEGNGTYNTTVSLNCLEGYKLNSVSQIRCADNEQWQGSLGHCLVKLCNEPLPQVAHGFLTFNGGIEGNGTYNTTVSLNCLEGYKLNSVGQFRCADNEQWQGSHGLYLVIRCKELLQQEYGTVIIMAGIEGNWTYNTTVTIECQPGYSLNDDGLVECIDNGQWNGTLGNCSETKTQKDVEPESSVASVAGGVTAALCVLILGAIIAFILYKRRARGREDKTVDTALNVIPSSSEGKEQEEKVILEKSIYAQPKKKKYVTKGPECDESKNVYMNSNDSSKEYYSFTSEKVTDKHSVRVEDLSSFFLSRKSEQNLYEEEYNKLPNGLIKSHEAALLEENRSKNRYKNIYPYDDTRVKLEIWNPSNENDYINACYINGFKTYHAYIAAQGPTKGILNDFWRMIWQTKCIKIVMLTNLMEEGKHKCEKYWPDEGSMVFGDIVVKLVQCETFADFTIRTLELRKKNEKPEGGRKETREIKQFHFTSWPDRGVPRFASSLVHFRYKIHDTKTLPNNEVPMVVHCSAGIGRTGTFLALDYLVYQAEQLGYINVVNCVETLRKQRVSLVQTVEQYIFLHEALVEALTCTIMAPSTTEFQEAYRNLLERDKKTGKQRLDVEFEKLPMYVSDPGEDVYENAKNMENRHKNRYSNILPDKNHCPFLNVYVKGRDSYINAVFLPAYKENDIFIITQTPLENTIVDFWRMVYQFEVSSIVMLNTLSEMKPPRTYVYDDLDLNEEERYWTEDDQTLDILPFRITLESKSSDDICTNYTMLLNYHDERRRVRLSRATYWADGKPVPKSPSAMLKQIDLIQNWQQETGNKPIIVHCMNGAERSGLFCVITALLERTKIEQDVAVEQIIKQMRSRRPQVIPSVDQFKFCYDTVLAYLDQFDTYSNFTGL